MHYNKENGHFVYGEPKLPVIQDELELCGYFAIISSEKMDAKDAINLYKSRDVSENVFRADKSYLGNHCLRVASEEAALNKIFIGFLALIIRCRIYTALKEKAEELAKNRIILQFWQQSGNWKRLRGHASWIRCTGLIMQ